MANTHLPLFILLYDLAIQLTSSSGDGSACPNDPVVFTCTIDGSAMQWVVNPPTGSAFQQVFQTVFDTSGDLLPAGVEGFMFQVAITATNPFTSSLATLTEVSSLNGTTVSCFTGQTESLTIIVAGELYVHCIIVCTYYLSHCVQSLHLLHSLRWCLHNKMVSVSLC